MSPVEKVARAICGADPDARWHLYKSDAELAIAAYESSLEATGRVIVPREPTERMLANGWNGQHAGYGIGKARLPDVYRRMVDASLSPRREDEG